MAKNRSIPRSDSKDVEIPATHCAQELVEGTPRRQSEEVHFNPGKDHPEPTCDAAIKELAHCKWEAAGCPPGDGIEFWLAAEFEILRNAQ